MTTVISGTTGCSQVQAGSINQDDLAANVVGKGPAFSAYQSSATYLAAGTGTAVSFQVEEFDTANCYDTATSRFTPNVAGYYQINAKVRADIPANSVLSTLIVKNGVVVKEGGFVGTNSSQVGANVSALIYLNGTTDYISVSSFSGTAGNTSVGSASTWLQGFLVRAA